MSSSESQTITKTSKPISIWSIIWTIVWLALIALLLARLFIYQQVNVVGSSMEPNYYTDERLVVNRRNKNFVRGQVVAVYADKELAKNANYLTPYDSQTRFFLKRIIGLPGEEVEIVGSKVIIFNSQFPEGRIINEDYVDPTVKKREEVLKFYFPRTKINNAEYFVLGDNRANSTDSRREGNFPDYAIFGQETFRYWPIAKASLFELPDYTFSKLSPDFEQTREEFKNYYYKNRLEAL